MLKARPLGASLGNGRLRCLWITPREVLGRDGRGSADEGLYLKVHAACRMKVR